MLFTIKRTTLCGAAAAVAIGLSAVANAHSPVPLTDHQLDTVTAAQGGPTAAVTAATTATGLSATGTAQTLALVTVSDSPFDGAGAQAAGVAWGIGMNGASPGGSNASVSTFAEAPGNVQGNVGWNLTIYNNGLTFSVGVQSSVGILVPGCGPC
jgi:hypothetical protein